MGWEAKLAGNIVIKSIVPGKLDFGNKEKKSSFIYFVLGTMTDKCRKKVGLFKINFFYL